MEMTNKDRLARMLSAACYEKYKEMGISMEAVAAGANVSTASVAGALKDGTTTRRSTWIRVCETLGVDMEEIEKRCEKMADREKKTAETLTEKEPEGVVIHAAPEELYRLYLFCEERMADNLRMGTRMAPEQLYKLMQAMYALRDASLAMQPGETVEPQEEA